MKPYCMVCGRRAATMRVEDQVVWVPDCQHPQPSQRPTEGGA